MPQFTADNVDEVLPQDCQDYGTVNDIYFAIPNDANFKSLVWYSPKTFAAAGYTVPTTWDELVALSGQDRRHRREAVVRRHRLR